MIRHANEDDTAFIVDSWMKSFADSPVGRILGVPGQRCMQCEQPLPRDVRPSGWYEAGQRRLAKSLMARSTVLVATADDVGDGTMIDGYAVYGRGLGRPGTPSDEDWRPVWVVHYVYVRHSARGRGVAKRLLAEPLSEPSRVCFTHASRHLDKGKLPKNWHYDAFEIYRFLETTRAA
jgi:GNAT superfamily N-acetyltransferase